LGRFTGKLRAMGREFQMAMNDAAKSSGLDEVRKDMNDIVSKKSLGLDALETAAKRFETWDPTRPAAAATATVAAASAAAAAEATAEEIAADEALGLHEAEKPLTPASGAAPAKSDT
ncbi:MAG: twin-arginine translocase subunit TatB, partial [Gemmobacter sp.]